LKHARLLRGLVNSYFLDVVKDDDGSADIVSDCVVSDDIDNNDTASNDVVKNSVSEFLLFFNFDTNLFNNGLANRDLNDLGF
jgi:hypothetical protein